MVRPLNLAVFAHDAPPVLSLQGRLTQFADPADASVHTTDTDQAILPSWPAFSAWFSTVTRPLRCPSIGTTAPVAIVSATYSAYVFHTVDDLQPDDQQ
jgi:hypothetical protein